MGACGSQQDVATTPSKNIAVTDKTRTSLQDILDQERRSKHLSKFNSDPERLRQQLKALSKRVEPIP